MTFSINFFDPPNLTDEEKLNGFIFTSNQLTILKLEVTAVVHQLANFAFDDPVNLTKGALDHAVLRGQLMILQTLIDRHETSQQILLQVAQQQAALQAQSASAT